MNSLKLPIVFDVALTTDCRLQERLSIIQTSPHGKAWLATHLDVFMDDDLSIGFGTGNYVAHLNYFDDILNSREINIWETPPNQIVNILLKCIENKSYIVMDLYFEKKYKDKMRIDKPYSTLIYGFDQSKSVFYSINLQDNKYVESEITFSDLQELYNDVCDLYREDATTKVLRQFFNFAITSITLRDDYSEDNCIFTAIVDKLGHEEVGNTMIIQQYDATLNRSRCFERFTGINCLLGIEKFLQNYNPPNHSDNSILKDLHKSIYQLYEHRKIIYSSMDWINKELSTNNEQIIISTQKYSHAVEKIYNIYMLIGKLIVTKKDNLLIKIRNQLIEQYTYEKNVLIDYIGLTFKEYILQSAAPKFSNIKNSIKGESQ